MIKVAMNLTFFLGGADLEMVVIRDVLDRHASGNYVDKGLSWGARVSDYRDEVLLALDQGRVPVLVELIWDVGDEIAQDRCVIVDHHGDLAGADRPSSLRQVFDLLALPKADWSRHFELVSANDIGHIRAMKAMGASATEIADIRRDDRAAQRVSGAEEEDARRAISVRQVVSGRKPGLGLSTVDISFDRSTAVADLMETDVGGPGYDNLLVLMPHEISFFGQGKVVLALKDAVPQSWWGGALPERGFWGCNARDQNQARVSATIRKTLT